VAKYCRDGRTGPERAADIEQIASKSLADIQKRREESIITGHAIIPQNHPLSAIIKYRICCLTLSSWSVICFPHDASEWLQGHESYKLLIPGFVTMRGCSQIPTLRE